MDFEYDRVRDACFCTGRFACIVERMFEEWPDSMQPSLRRVVDPPRPVMVDLNLAIPTQQASFGRNKLPLRVKAGGLNLFDPVPGWLFAWARVSNGEWIALVAFEMVTSNGQGRVKATQWCPAAAVSKAPPH
ncbi:hypothetical protein ACFYY5_29700 [Nocardia elegans]|uniref:Uncharacterized protein n=1 Tax=Nocardia elegans TaxID=300029 RepID=A0ABW6TLL5_9NOCA